MDRIIELGRVSEETHGLDGPQSENWSPPCVDFGCD
jgi:hypothetical protein